MDGIRRFCSLLAIFIFINCVFLFVKSERKEKKSIFDISKYLDKGVRVKFQGGREGNAHVF